MLAPLSSNVQAAVIWVANGYQTAGAIAELCGIRPTGVSNDLAHARRLGLLECHKVGRQLEHTLTDLAASVKWLQEDLP